MLNQPISSDFEFPRQQQDVKVDLNPGSVNPFPGLRPFSMDESHLFFGREGQVDELLVKLSQSRFIAVMGYSGSGKSSLMYCGLIPVLYGGFVTQTGPFWTIITTRPGTAPIASLTESIIDHLSRIRKINDGDMTVYKAMIASLLRGRKDGLIEVAKYLRTGKNENIFFLVDQFEEIFRFSEAASQDAIDEAHQYVNLFLTAAGQKEMPLYSALAMRSDFIGNCSVFPGLTQLINKSNYLVPQMTREQKKMVIEGPVVVAGGRITQRLVKRLLGDMGNNQDQLPILQHAMLRTWDYWIQNRDPGEPIDIRHYNAIGQISQALSLHANEAYDELSTREREIAAVVFKSITEKKQEDKGMRRPTRLDLIAEIAEANEHEVIKVVEHFRRPGRSFLMPAATIPLRSDSLIELSHESLMRIWNRLDSWVEEEYESAQMYKRLSAAAAMYQIGKTGLWRPPDLQLALNWQKKQKPSRAWAQRYDEAFERAIVFLDTSRITYEAELRNQEMMQRRVLRRTRATAIILGIAAVVAILFMVFAYIQMLKADEQTRLALHQEEIAVYERNEAQTQKNQADSLRVLAEMARVQLEVTNMELQDALLEISFARENALNATQMEKTARELAERSLEEAEKQSQLATKREREAREAYEAANRLYMLTKAQALATKSMQENDDADLAGLLAMQAYHYHLRFHGKKYDPYIYSGLYYSLTKLSNSSLAYNAIRVPGPRRNKVNSLAVSRIGNKFYAAAADGRIFQGRYDSLSGSHIKYANPYPNKIIALSKDEKYLVNGSDSSFVQVHKLNEVSVQPVTIGGFRGATNDLQFLPDNSGFVIASGDYQKKNYDISLVDHFSGSVNTLLSLPFEVKSIDISPNGKWLAGGTWDGKVLLIDLESRRYSVTAEEPGARILCVKYSADGKTLAYGTDDMENKRGLVKLIEIGSGEIRQFTGHLAGVFDVEFSPDGELLASAGSDRRLQMWVLSNPGDLPVEMDNNHGFVFDIEFTNDSRYLIAATSESEIRVWPTDLNMLARQICPALKRNLTLDEWNKYVGDDVNYENTCARVLINDY